MTTPTTPTTPSDDLEAAARAATNALTPERREALMQTAECNWSQSGILRNLASGLLAYEAALSDVETERLADKAKIAELEGSQHHFRDEDWPLALQRLNHTEPGPDQGIALVGTDDLAFALERLAHFAQVAMGNALAVSTAEARALSAEAAQARAEFLLAVMAATFDGPHGWWETRRLWHSAVQDNYENAYVEQTVADEWRKRKEAAEAALRASQEALGKAVEGLNEALACIDADQCVEGFTRVEAIYRQTLAQVEGGGEDKGSIPGTRPDDLRASRGEGSGS